MGFDRIDVTSWKVMSVESTGADARYWLTLPADTRTPDKSEWWLYKAVKHGTVKDKGGRPVGEYRRSDDRVERLACELANLLGIPTARIELARRGREEGVVSHNVAGRGWELQPADVMLSEYPGYVQCAVDRRMRDRPGHNLVNIGDLLGTILGPPGTPVAEWGAYDVFCGYLVFDAWIANTDRHALNWAVLQSADGDRLAPTFDHGSALGSGLEDARRRGHLDAGVDSWCGGGLAPRFEGGRKFTLVQLARRAIEQGGPCAPEWLDRLASMPRDAWRSVLERVPGVSDVEGTFIDEVLLTNQRRLCDDSRSS